MKHKKFVHDIKRVVLVYVNEAVQFDTGENRSAASVILSIDATQFVENADFAKLAEAVKHFTTQNQWPPVADIG